MVTTPPRVNNKKGLGREGGKGGDDGDGGGGEGDGRGLLSGHPVSPQW